MHSTQVSDIGPSWSSCLTIRKKASINTLGKLLDRDTNLSPENKILDCFKLKEVPGYIMKYDSNDCVCLLKDIKHHNKKENQGSPWIFFSLRHHFRQMRKVCAILKKMEPVGAILKMKV